MAGAHLFGRDIPTADEALSVLALPAHRVRATIARRSVADLPAFYRLARNHTLEVVACFCEAGLVPLWGIDAAEADRLVAEVEGIAIDDAGYWTSERAAGGLRRGGLRLAGQTPVDRIINPRCELGPADDRGDRHDGSDAGPLLQGAIAGRATAAPGSACHDVRLNLSAITASASRRALSRAGEPRLPEPFTVAGPLKLGSNPNGTQRDGEL